MQAVRSFRVEAQILLPVTLFVDARFPEEAIGIAEGLIGDCFEESPNADLELDTPSIEAIDAIAVDFLDGDQVEDDPEAE